MPGVGAYGIGDDRCKESVEVEEKEECPDYTSASQPNTEQVPDLLQYAANQGRHKEDPIEALRRSQWQRGDA